MQRQRIIFSAFRADQYSDPEGYLTSLGLVLEQYPNDVIIYITDPRTGVQRYCKWPPTISEIVEACDKRIAELRRDEEFRNWGRRDEPALLEAPRENRPTLEELHAKYGKNWGLTSLDEKRDPRAYPSFEQVAASYSADPSRIARLMAIADQHREYDIPTQEQS